MAKTMFEKIWEAHEVGGPESGLIYVDLHLVRVPDLVEQRLWHQLLRRPALSTASNTASSGPGFSK